LNDDYLNGVSSKMTDI